MAGIYFHIPFCKKKCNYCDFYSKRDSKGIIELVKAEIKELIFRKDYLDNELILIKAFVNNEELIGWEMWENY